jgi:hypothetical protein
VKRVFLAGGAAGIALMVALVIAGGLSFKREVDYVECERFAVPSAIVRVQSSPVGPTWGHPRFVELSIYGPPYDLLIEGTFAPGGADGTAAAADAAGALPDALAITDLIVEADGAVVLSLHQVSVEVEGGAPLAAPGGGKRSLKHFKYRAPAFTSATPARLRVAGTLAPARDKSQRFAHVFEAHRIRRLALGPWTWTF